MMYTILIVDDHFLFREGIRSLISRWEDFLVVGEAADGVQAVQLAREHLPDIVLMDINLPQLDGIEATWQISRELPSVKVVILTMSAEEENLFQAIKSGAAGYILKDTPSKRLHDQMRGVMRGESPLSGIMATKIMKEFLQPAEKAEDGKAAAKEPLTNREQQVLELVADGLSNPDIAGRLFLSESTIKKYIHNILTKLQLNNRVEAAIYAMRHRTN